MEETPHLEWMKGGRDLLWNVDDDFQGMEGTSYRHSYGSMAHISKILRGEGQPWGFGDGWMRL